MPVLFVVVAAVLLYALCGFISKKLTGKVQTAFVFTQRLLVTALAAFAIFLLVLANSTELRSLWFATVFGPLMLKGDGLTPLRCGSVAAATGVVLELGPGPGTNFQCWGGNSTITEWIGVEPNERFKEQQQQQREIHGFDVPARSVWTTAESIGVNAGSVDTVVATHLLCSVDNATKVLQEVARVLKPGGKFVFLEHSLDPDSKSWRHLAQVAIAPFINILADGCKSLSIKETIMEATSSTSQLELTVLREVDARVDQWLFKPHTVGVLTKQQGPPDSFTKHMAHETAEADKARVKQEEQEAIHTEFKQNLKPIIEENRARDEHKKLHAITKQKQERLREAQINLAAHRLKMAAAAGEPIEVDPVPARKPLPYLDSEL